MNKHLKMALVVVLPLLACAGIGVCAEDAEWTPEQQAVIDAVKDGPVGIEADFDAWASGYADDWTYWRVGDPGIRRRDAHMKLVREFVQAGNRVTDFALEPVDVVIRGDVAMLRLIATESFVNVQGETNAVRYASATVLTRDEAGWTVLATNIVYLDD